MEEVSAVAGAADRDGGAGRGRHAGDAQEAGRLPLIVLLLTAPLYGLAFAVFLPFIGFLVCGEAVLMKLRSLWHGRR